MKAKYLLPHTWKKYGWILFLIGSVLGILFIFFGVEPSFLKAKFLAIAHQEELGKTKYFSFVETNLIDEIAAIFTIIGGLIVAFSQEKVEDEFIQKIRLESLVWAIYVNSFMLLFTTLFFYDTAYMKVMMINIGSPLLFFILKFHWELFKLKREKEL